MLNCGRRDLVRSRSGEPSVISLRGCAVGGGVPWDRIAGASHDADGTGVGSGIAWSVEGTVPDALNDRTRGRVRGPSLVGLTAVCGTDSTEELVVDADRCVISGTNSCRRRGR